FYVFCFFFSSRRRHTRFSRDWSSDVCSSDLAFKSVGAFAEGVGVRGESVLGESGGGAAVGEDQWTGHGYLCLSTDAVAGSACLRSEERRVGKERRSRRLLGH